MQYLKLLPILFLLSCKSTVPTDSEDVLIKMQRTPCYGTCPVYTLSIYENGLVKLHSTSNLDLIGDYKSRVPKSEIKMFKKQFAEISFFTLKDEYTSNITDLPSTIVTYSSGGKTKTVIDYHKAPEKLKVLEGNISNLITKLTWEKVK